MTPHVGTSPRRGWRTAAGITAAATVATLGGIGLAAPSASAAPLDQAGPAYARSAPAYARSAPAYARGPRAAAPALPAETHSSYYLNLGKSGRVTVQVTQTPDSIGQIVVTERIVNTSNRVVSVLTNRAYDSFGRLYRGVGGMIGRGDYFAWQTPALNPPGSLVLVVQATTNHTLHDKITIPING